MSQIFKVCCSFRWKDVLLLCGIFSLMLNLIFRWSLFKLCEITIRNELAGILVLPPLVRFIFWLTGNIAFCSLKRIIFRPSNLNRKVRMFCHFSVPILFLFAIILLSCVWLRGGIEYFVNLSPDTIKCLGWSGFWNYVNLIIVGVYYVALWIVLLISIIFIGQFAWNLRKGILRTLVTLCKEAQKLSSSALPNMTEGWIDELNEDNLHILRNNNEEGPNAPQQRLERMNPREIEDQIEDEVCSICLEGFQMSLQEVSQLHPCLHYFHYDCLYFWLRYNVTCPLCRQTISNSFTPVSNEEIIEMGF